MNDGEREPVSRIGEVVQSATQGFTAQCYRLFQAPPLGMLVKTSSPEIYAVVSSITTESLYPGRPVVARGEDEESEEGVYQSNPQLDRLLCTRFEVVIAGHDDGGSVVHGLPPLPPRIHAFVYSCSAAEVDGFTSSMDFLRLLLNINIPAGDEVIAACLLGASAVQDSGSGFLLRVGKALAGELAGDLPRLNSLLRRISP